MSKFILLSEKKWHDSLFERLHKSSPESWVRIQSKEKFTLDELNDLQPDLIFIPHWSEIIPESIYENFECIVFHMTDLPYGRGGSPLQNLIVRGHTSTVISAIRVMKGIDKGDVYLKKSLDLNGSAEEIFIRASDVIEKMIEDIIRLKPNPVKQEGEVVIFKRRTPEESEIGELESIEKVYDYIRMLDCEGYPPAFLETKYLKFEFRRASLKGDKSILADVRITKK
jgi:methionyl-tRNA formyltransferase